MILFWRTGLSGRSIYQWGGASTNAAAAASGRIDRLPWPYTLKFHSLNGNNSWLNK